MRTKSKKMLAIAASALGCLCLGFGFAARPVAPANVTTANAEVANETVSLLDMSKTLNIEKTYLSACNGYHGPNDLGFGREWFVPEIVSATGSNGEATNVLKMGFSFSWGASNGTVVFDNPIALAEVESLELKVYANFSTADNSYKTDLGGVRLFAKDDTGAAGEGYMIPGNIQQRQWVTITLTGADLALLADANGMLSGLRSGNVAGSTNNANADFLGEKQAYMYIESIVATKAAACNHTWVDATCAAPKTCSACGETEGEKLTHAWVDATCAAPKTCSACGETEGEKLAHTWVDATCTEPKACSTCGKVYGKEEKALLDMNKTLTVDKAYPSYCNGYHGANDLGLGRQWHKPEIVSATGSNGTATNVLKMGFSFSWGGSNGTVIFDNPIALEGASKLELKIYANLSSQDNFYDTSLGGVRLMATDCAGGVGEGYMIPANIQQREWVTLTLTGADLAAFADSNGMLSGLRYANVAASNSDANFLSGQNAYIYVESIVVTVGEDSKPLGHTWVDATCTTPKMCSVCSTVYGVEEAALLDMNKTLTVDKAYPSYCNGYHGANDLGLGRQWHKPEIVSATGSNGTATNVLKMGFSFSWGGSNGTVIFDNPIALEGASKLELKIYANLSSQDNFYDTSLGGVRLMATDCAGGVGEGYMIPANIQQREWVTLTLTGADLAAFADSNGMLSGLRYANVAASNSDANFLSGQNAYIYVESIVVTVGEYVEPSHTWTDATCTAPKTCSVCGETEGEALGHTWVDADCDTPKTCSVCSATEGEALGHTWVDADCDTPKTCSVCSATEGEALGHTWVDADCDTPKTCSVCSATEGEALGHTYGDWVVTKEATATEDGSKEKTCACGDKVTETIPALGESDEPTSDVPSSDEPTSDVPSSDEPTSEAPSSEPATDSDSQSSTIGFGCGSVVGGIGLGMALLTMAGAVVLKKKED